MNKITDICKILVVDDEPNMCRGIERSLKNFNVTIEDENVEAGFKIDSVLSKEACLKIIEKNNYDIIFLDYKMPDVTGLELLQSVLEKNNNALVIMMTAYATFETAVQSTKLGAFDFLPKPFSSEELRDAVKKAAKHSIFAKRAQNFEEEKKRIRFQFISVLSHELKAPLNAIEGYIDILTNRLCELPEQEAQNMLSRCKLRIDGMRKLVADLLDLTKIESGDKQRHIDKVNLYDTANSSLELFINDAKKKNISIKLDVNENLNISADRSEIEIILNNLISNAIKYNKNDGTVTVKIKEYMNKLLITVADNGLGISKVDQKKLFKEFSRIKNKNTIHIVGSGLGLYTIHKVVDFYNGTIKLRSKEGKGSVFRVKLNTIII